jgi:hypothetical protein
VVGGTLENYFAMEPCENVGENYQTATRPVPEPEHGFFDAREIADGTIDQLHGKF